VSHQADKRKCLAASFILVLVDGGSESLAGSSAVLLGQQTSGTLQHFLWTAACRGIAAKLTV